MDLNWIDGSLQEIPVRWLRLETTVPVNQEKELLYATITLKHPPGPRIFWDYLFLRRNLFNERVLGNNIVYIPVAAGTEEIPIFGAIGDCVILACHLVPKQPIIGDNPPLQLEIVNTDPEEGGTVCTKTFISGSDAPAYEVTEFGPVDSDASQLLDGFALKVVADGGSLPTDIILIIEWNIM